jgi:hypothetical protein
VTDFDTKLVEIPRGAGISISKGRPALAGLRPAFKAAWHKVAHRDDQFRHGDFANAPDSTAITSASTPTPESNFRLDDLLAEFLSDRARPAKDVSEMKTYVHLQKIGGIGIELVGPEMRAGLSVDELRAHPHLIAAVLFAALQLNTQTVV